MGIQLKPGLFKPGFDLNELKFEEIIIADANTRYRYAIAKISEAKEVYVIKKNNKFLFYKDEVFGCRIVNIWPDRESCHYCKENDDFFKNGNIICLDAKDFYHNILSEFHKKTVSAQ